MSKSKGGKGKAAVKKDTKTKPVRRTTKHTTTTTTTTTASTTAIVKKASAAPLWTKVFILGRKLDDPAKEVLLKGDFSFPDIHQLIAEHHPGCDAYVYHCPEVHGSMAELLIPVLVVILVPQGQLPPSFIARVNSHQGTETIISMKDLNLTWQEDRSHLQAGRASGGLGAGAGGRVFTLQCSRRMTKAAFGALGEAALYDYEYGTPFNIIPSLQRAALPQANFEVMLPNGKEVDLTFPGGTEKEKVQFIQDIIEAYAEEGLNEEHFDSVKAAVDEAVQEQLDEAQMKRDLLADYDDETLASMKCIKIYSNDVNPSFICDYVSKYYSRAIATYPFEPATAPTLQWGPNVAE